MTRTFVTQDGTCLPRRMSISPLGPRELGGLKGFGFTVNFEDTPSSEPISSPAETKAADAPPPASAATIRKRTARDYRKHCLKPDACGSAKLAHCRTCAIAAGLIEVEA